MSKRERSAVHKILEAALKKDWSLWRNYYEQLKINDLIFLNLGVDGFIPEQICKTEKEIEAIFKLEEIDKSEKLDVIELGCYRGGLAYYILRSFPKFIRSWTGYDINYYAVKAPIPRDIRYKGIKQVEWFYNLEFDPDANTFVSTSTLEHHSREQVVKIVERLRNSNIKYIVIGLPLSDKNWEDYKGSHVLDMSREEITELLEINGFKVFYNEKNKIWNWGAKRK